MTFNSLFEIQRGRLEDDRAGGAGALSILFLRFNPGNSRRSSSASGSLSILFLRFEEANYNIKICAKSKGSFNSLFEIHAEILRHSGRRNKPLSILFLRFLPRSSGIALTRFPFNSLFEILKRYLSERHAENREYFQFSF